MEKLLSWGNVVRLEGIYGLSSSRLLYSDDPKKNQGGENKKEDFPVS